MTTQEQTLETFKKLCQKYINFLGVHDFHVSYEIEDPGEEEEGVSCKYYLDRTGGQIITLSLNPKFEFNQENLKLTAKHEIIEALLLGKIRERKILKRYTDDC
jgi:hypothetical protein